MMLSLGEGGAGDTAANLTPGSERLAMVEAGGLLKSLRMNEVNSTEAMKCRETQSR